MNQDFTVQKKQYLSEKKKFVQTGSPEKKQNSCNSSERKNKFVEAKNCPAPPPPSNHFSNGPSLTRIN